MKYFEFQSDKLDTILETVRKNHPNRKGGAVSIEANVIEEVKAMLEAAASDEIPNLAFQFNSKQLMACIEIVCTHDDFEIKKKAARIAKVRPRDQMVPRLWFKLIKHYPNQVPEGLLKDLLGKRGAHLIENHPKISNRALHWLMSTNLTAGILKDYSESNDSCNFNIYLEKNLLNETDTIHSLAWRSLLLNGSEEMLKQQPPEMILETISKAMESEARMRMGQHYLNTLKNFPNWDLQIIEYLHEKWDRPKAIEGSREVENRFWQGVNDFAKRNFNAWLMEREIDSFFDGERADFWRVYLKSGHINYVEKILNGDGFMLDFGKFGVIEFKHTGNAAYVYPSKRFKYYRSIAKHISDAPARFKDQNATVNSSYLPRWDGRILHFQGWQERAKNNIDMVIRTL